jgi:D-lyxose ketol-isomerase
MIVNEPEIAAAAQKIVRKTWGVEFWMTNSELYCLKFLKVIPGFQSSIHAHAIKDETFLGWSGMVQLNLYDSHGAELKDARGLPVVVPIYPGQQHRIKPETFHSFQAVNEAWILEISTRHSDKDVIRLQESRKLVIE